MNPGGGIPLRYLVEEIDERSGAELPLLSVSIHLGVRRRDEITDDEPRADTLDTYKRCRRGDVVVNRMRAFQGALGVAPIDGLVSPDYAVLRPSDAADARFVAYVLRSPWGVAEMTSRLRGIGGVASGVVRTPRVNVADLFDIRIPASAIGRQAAIADFLDRERERVSRLESALAAARARCHELRRVHADECVADAPCSRLGWVAEVRSGITLNGQSAEHGQGVPYLRVANVQTDHVDLDDVKTIQVSASEIAKHALMEGDLLMTEGGDIDKLGRGPVWKGEISPCLHQNHVFAVRFDRSRVLPEFGGAVTRSSVARDYFERTASRITNIASTNATKVRAMPFPLPSLDEQRERLNRLTVRDDAVTAAVVGLERAVSLLREYRDAVVSEAVTGQLDLSSVSDAEMDERARAAAEGVVAVGRSSTVVG